jgi:uncharacterized protein
MRVWWTVAVTRDPAEGVDAEGLIVTGAAAERIGAGYRSVVADCVGTLREVFGGRLHSLYVYGSVATGQARAPESDLDLVPVWLSAVPAAEVRQVAARLSARHAEVVREVGLAGCTLAEVLADNRAGYGMRCFLRHYCVFLTGVDLRPSLPPCVPSRAVADGFNDDVAALVRRWRSELDAARTPARVAAVARAAARKLLLVTATLESVEHGGWTTDRATGAALLARHHPQWAAVAELAVGWSARHGDAAARDVRRLLDLGDWLAARPRP